MEQYTALWLVRGQYTLFDYITTDNIESIFEEYKDQDIFLAPVKGHIESY